MTDFDRLQVQLYKLNIPFTKEEDNVLCVFAPNDNTQYVVVMYSPIKDAIAWLDVNKSGYDLGIAETWQELITKIMRFCLEGDIDFIAENSLDKDEEV